MHQRRCKLHTAIDKLLLPPLSFAKIVDNKKTGELLSRSDLRLAILRLIYSDIRSFGVRDFQIRARRGWL